MLYFWLVREVPAPELLAHRIAWLVPLLIALLAVRGGGRTTIEFLRHGEKRRTLLLTTVLLSINWFIFIWAPRTTACSRSAWATSSIHS